MALKTYSAPVSAAPANGVEEEIFIPLADLRGSLTLDDAEPKVNYGRGLLMFAEKVYEVLSPSAFAKLGMSVSKSDNGSNGVSNNVFSLSCVLVGSSDPAFGDTQTLPVPAAGSNIGVGAITLTDVFPGAVWVMYEDSISGAGISFTYADLEQYVGVNFVDSNSLTDVRRILMAMYFDLGFNQTVRAAGETSAVTASTLSTPTGFAITATAVNTTDGTIGIDEAYLDNVFASSRTASFAVQTTKNIDTNTYDVLVA